ncbi:MAG: double-strand break repair helicase AddA [Methyloceanibacter sp.]
MNARPLPPEADANQARASDPGASAWVSANAGTGKTEVLVKRALRLLLAGFRPEAILCLTYTKTAAAEMQNRLLKVLGEWATVDQDKLCKSLLALLRRAPDETELGLARRLFAHALEAKGGLKIHTIHGFCERLLLRFPLEAGVTPHFSVLEEEAQAKLRRAAFDSTMARAAKDGDGPLGRALAKVVTLTSGDNLRRVIDTVLGKRADLARLVAHHGDGMDWPEAEALALKRLFGVDGQTEAALIEALANVLSEDELEAAIDAISNCDASGKSDLSVAASLREARLANGESRAAALLPVFLTGKNEPQKRICTQGFCRAFPSTAARLSEAQAKFAALKDKLAHLRLAEVSAAVLALADAVLAEYQHRKQADAALDYADLIVKAQNLLSRADAASWVLYKIDGGVDHILVDEAQDTNPEQWSIVESLAAEFFAGEGRSTRLRTLFAVGDEKQSIYSFQGADPVRFGEVGRDFRQRANAVAHRWEDVPLTLSFRSTEPVLDAVDAVFATSAAAAGLTWQEGARITHHPFRTGEAGLVELWDVEKDDGREDIDPFAPWEEETARESSVERVCKRIASTIDGWLKNGELLVSRGRPIKAGDILILVRRRDPFTTPMIRALKRLQVPVAGADRMKLMEQLAVQDLIALADFLLMPDDDLTLAVVLKSPLFGLNDDHLFKLAHKRDGSLWASLQAKAEKDPRYTEAVERLTHWLARADYQPPYEFYSEMLDGDGQRLRKAMLTRLGPEAAEAIDEFLDRAIAFDRDEAPSLQGFINQMRASEVEVKRDMDQERDEVRIMTVHGAKGLQAPIVFLPDTCAAPRAQHPRLFSLPRWNTAPDEVGHILWPPAGHPDLEGIAAAKRAADMADREEYHRLLYVAMTRARDRLYICGWEGVRGRDKDKCWYDLVCDGLKELLSPATGSDGKAVHRMESKQTERVPEAAAMPEVAEAAPLPTWALEPGAPERARPRLAPSRLTLGTEEGAEALGPEQAPLGPLTLSLNYRFARGRLVHALLQHLPEIAPEQQERATRTFVAARGAELTQELRDEIVAETLAVVRQADFAPLFQPGSIAEVPIVARIGGADLEGQIDRLVQTEAGLLILDYKTNRPPPTTLEEVAEAYIAQLAAYRTALKSLYPGRSLRAALLWTDGPRLMEIPSDRLDAAERRLLARQGEP